MNLHARLGRLERAQPIEPDRTHSNAALAWLMEVAAQAHPELNARILELDASPDRTPEAMAVAVVDLLEASKLANEFFNRCRQDRTG